MSSESTKVPTKLQATEAVALLLLYGQQQQNRAERQQLVTALYGLINAMDGFELIRDGRVLLRHVRHIFVGERRGDLLYCVAIIHGRMCGGTREEHGI